MTRSVDEWIGDNDDHVPPPRVRARVFERCGGRCHKCRRKVMASDTWTLEHLVAITNGGANRESNLDVTCEWCLPAKNRADAAIKRKGTKVRYRHMGIKAKQARPMPGTKASGLRRRFDGTVERRDE